MGAATQPDTRERLVSAATALFARDGYHAASLREAAAAAGLTTGAVYSRFGSTAEMAATRDSEDVSRAAGDQWIDRLEREGGWHLAVLEFRAAAARDPRLR